MPIKLISGEFRKSFSTAILVQAIFFLLVAAAIGVSCAANTLL